MRPMQNTETIYTEVSQAIVARYGKTYEWSLKSQMMGKKAPDAAKLLVETLQLPITPEQYLEEREQKQNELFPDCKIMPGAHSLVSTLKKNSIPLAVKIVFKTFLVQKYSPYSNGQVASSSFKKIFEIKTQKHKDFFNLFDAIVLGDDPHVHHGKPAPDIFIEASKRLGTFHPSECLVFEDAISGVQAAINANMHVVMVPDPNLDLSFQNTLPNSAPHQILSSLEEFNPSEWGLPF